MSGCWPKILPRKEGGGWEGLLKTGLLRACRVPQRCLQALLPSPPFVWGEGRQFLLLKKVGRRGEGIRPIPLEGHSTKYLVSTPYNLQGYPKQGTAGKLLLKRTLKETRKLNVMEYSGKNPRIEKGQ